MKLALLGVMLATPGVAAILQADENGDGFRVVPWGTAAEVLQVLGVAALLLAPFVVKWGRAYFADVADVKKNREAIADLERDVEAHDRKQKRRTKRLEDALNMKMREMLETAERADEIHAGHVKEKLNGLGGRIDRANERIGKVQHDASEAIRRLDTVDVMRLHFSERLGALEKSVEAIRKLDARVTGIAAVLAAVYPDQSRHLLNFIGEGEQ